MAQEANKQRAEQRILWISFGAGAGFAIVELISAIWLKSQSVLMDAAYDASELIVIILTLFLTPLFHKPISEKHPYGYSQVESVFIIIKSFMMLSVTLSLSMSSLNVALSGGREVDGGKISLLQLILGGASFLIYLLLKKMNRSVASPTVHAELLGWRLDVAYSGGMALAFYASTFLSLTPLAFLAPYFDQLVAVVLVCFNLPETVKMLWRAIEDVFLFSPEESLVEEVKGLCDPILKEYAFEPVFYDITRTGRCLWVSIYFRIREDMLSIGKLQKASEHVRHVLQEQIENCSSELIVVSQGTEGLLKTMSLPE